MEENITSFSTIYDVFLTKTTDDMYMELTELDTYRMLFQLLLQAISWFEFPRVDLDDYELTDFAEASTYCGVDSNMVEVPATIYNEGHFNSKLSQEEINILASYMVVAWIGQQLATVENTRLKYSGSDFKFTSQANHLTKLQALKRDYEREGFHLQRLYSRRKKDEKSGIMKSIAWTFDSALKD